MMTQLASAEALLQARLVNNLFMSKSVEKLLSARKTLTSQDHSTRSSSVSNSQRTQKKNACECKLTFGLYCSHNYSHFDKK